MKKYMIRILTVLCLVCFGAAMFVGCKEEPKEPPVEDTQYTVTYAAGGGTGTAPAVEKYKEGDTFKVKENPFSKEGSTFKTWNDGSKDYAPGADYTMPKKNVTFTAQWEENGTKPEPEKEQVTVTFDLGENTEGKVPAAKKVNKGEEYTLPAAPAWEGHMFTGWKVGDGEVKKTGEKITVDADVKLTAQYKVAAYELTGAEIETTEDTAYLVLTGTYEGYTDAEIKDLLEGLEPGLYGGGWASADTEASAAQGKWTFKFDVTDLDMNVPYSVCLNRSGTGDIKSLTVETSGVAGGKKYSLKSASGSNLTLTISDAGKVHAYTGMKLEVVENKVYLTVSGTYSGYTDDEFKGLLEGNDKKVLYIGVTATKAVGDLNEWGWPDCKPVVTATNGTFTVKLDVTDIPIVIYYVCENQSGSGDILWNQEAFASTVTANGKKYTVEKNGYGNTQLKVEEATEPPADQTCVVTGLDIAVDETAQKVYLTASGTFTGYTEAELKALFEGDGKMNVHFWDEKAGMEHPASVVVTTSAGTWTAKCDITDLKAGELRNVLINGELKLDIQNKTVTLGNKTFTLQKANGYGNNGLKVEIETTPTDPAYEVTAFTIEKQADEKVYLVYKGTCANYEQTALEAALKALPLRFDVIKVGGGKTGPEGNGWTFAMNGGTWEMKLNITVGDNALFTVGSTYFIDNLNNYTDGGKYFNLWNQTITVELGTNRYKTGGALADPNTWGNVTFTIEGEPSAPVFSQPTSARLELTNDKGNGTDEKFTNDIERAFFVISGTYTGEVTEAIAKDYFSKDKYPFEFGSYNSTKDRIRRISIDTTAHTYTVKFDVTWLPVGEHICKTTETIKLSKTACPDNTVKSVGSTYTLTNYSGQEQHDGSIVLKVERNYAVTGVTVQEESGKPTLTVSGTFDSAFTPEQIKKFLEDEDIRSMCVDLYGEGWNKVKTVVTTEAGKFTVKIDLSALANGSYSVCIDASGYGDIKMESITGTLSSGGKTYTLSVDGDKNVKLTIA